MFASYDLSLFVSAWRETYQCGRVGRNVVVLFAHQLSEKGQLWKLLTGRGVFK